VTPVEIGIEFGEFVNGGKVAEVVDGACAKVITVFAGKIIAEGLYDFFAIAAALTGGIHCVEYATTDLPVWF
jgi:hypothetical protein